MIGVFGLRNGVPHHFSRSSLFCLVYVIEWVGPPLPPFVSLKFGLCWNSVRGKHCSFVGLCLCLCWSSISMSIESFYPNSWWTTFWRIGWSTKYHQRVVVSCIYQDLPRTFSITHFLDVHKKLIQNIASNSFRVLVRYSCSALLDLIQDRLEF